jgi:hypothetical protein
LNLQRWRGVFISGITMFTNFYIDPKKIKMGVAR